VIKPRKKRWSGIAIFIRENINAYKIFAGNPEGRRLVTKRWLRWRMILK
jgi:hypothetical protein